MRKPTWRSVLVSLFALAIVGLDQLTKYLTAKNIPLYGTVTVIPKVVSLTYVRNTGAAWSIFSDHPEVMRWVFVALVFVFLGIVFFLLRKGAIRKPFEIWCIAAIAGGAVGNAIDRILEGSVCDMIRTDFINFPVFNVADSFITVGVILLAVYIIFFDKEKRNGAESGS